MDIRKLTCVIIKKNGEYLVGTILGTLQLRWSRYAYDAWRTRDIEKARKVARITGGTMVLFNPAVGEPKVLRCERNTK